MNRRERFDWGCRRMEYWDESGLATRSTYLIHDAGYEPSVFAAEESRDLEIEISRKFKMMNLIFVIRLLRSLIFEKLQGIICEMESRGG